MSAPQQIADACIALDGGRIQIVQAQGTDPEADDKTFTKGTTDLSESPQVQILHKLFECRARQINNEFPPHTSAAYLSGMLVASDAWAAQRRLPD